jgi:predicted acyl esterase
MPTTINPKRFAVSLVAAAVLLAAGSVATLTLGQGQDPEYPRHFGYVTMPDGVRLAYVAYLPAEEGAFPAVL